MALLGGLVRGKGGGVRADPTCVPELLEGPAQVQVHQARRVSPCWARPLLRPQTLSGVKPLTLGLLTAVVRCSDLYPMIYLLGPMLLHNDDGKYFP